MKTPVTAERVRQFLIYDEATGALVHRDRPGRKRRGEPATRPDNHGYLNVCIDGASYKAHRIAWLYVHGDWPTGQIDHANGDRADNRIANLREAGYIENGQNRATQSNNRSGYPGVSTRAGRGKWRAQISAGGVRHYLGSFDTPEKAHAAYVAAKARLHDFQPVQRPVVGKDAGKNRKSGLTC